MDLVAFCRIIGKQSRQSGKVVGGHGQDET